MRSVQPDQVPTLKWYDQLTKSGAGRNPISSDHANLLALYIRNIDDAINEDPRLTRGQKLSQKETIQLLLDTTKIFSFPNR